MRAAGLDARTSASLLLGVVVGAPLTIGYAAAGDALSVGLLLWVPLAAAAAYLLRREAIPPRGWPARLVVLFVLVAIVSTSLGLVRYRAPGTLLAFAYQLLLLSNLPLGWLLFRSLDHLRAAWAGFALSFTVAGVVPTVYLVATKAWEAPHGVHNDPAMRAAVYGWPNSYSVALAVGILFAGHLALTSERRVRIASAVAGLVLFAGLFLTFSRTGYVVLGLGVVVYAATVGGARLVIAAAGILAAALAAAVFMVPDFATTIFYSDTLRERVAFVLVVLRFAGPVILAIGSGFANTNIVLASHSGDQLVPGLSVGEMTTHDELLTVLLKTGVAGLALFAGLLVVTARRPILLASRPGPSRAAAQTCVAMLATVLASLFAGETLHYWPVSAIFWLSMGAFMRLPRDSPAL